MNLRDANAIQRELTKRGFVHITRLGLASGGYRITANDVRSGYSVAFDNIDTFREVAEGWDFNRRMEQSGR